MISEAFRPLVTDLASSTGLRVAGVAAGGLGEAALTVLRRRMPGGSRAAVARLKSPEVRRYIIAPARYQQAAGENAQASLRSIHDTLTEKVLRSHGATARAFVPGLFLDIDEEDHAGSGHGSAVAPHLYRQGFPAGGGDLDRLDINGNRSAAHSVSNVFLDQEKRKFLLHQGGLQRRQP